jgi:hypothetical protein
VGLFLENGKQLVDLLCSGVLPRFPKLKVVSVESGIGFIPFILEALDYAFEYSKVWRTRREFTQRPSEYFRQQVYGCYFFEELAPQRLLDRIGVDNVLFETDYPHPVCLYGNVREKIDSGLAGQPQETRRKLLFENAAKLYRVEAPDRPVPVPEARGRARRMSARRQPFDLLGVDAPGVRIHLLVVPAAGHAGSAVHRRPRPGARRACGSANRGPRRGPAGLVLDGHDHERALSRSWSWPPTSTLTMSPDLRLLEDLGDQRRTPAARALPGERGDEQGDEHGQRDGAREAHGDSPRWGIALRIVTTRPLLKARLRRPWIGCFPARRGSPKPPDRP